MNRVIEFPRHRADSTEPRMSATPGEVVIFPGVRIERRSFSLSDCLEPPPTRSGKAAKPREVETV